MQKDKILVSVIIPCYNVEQYVAECIESVLSQTYPDIEILVVDNNSTDQTFSIIQNYQKKYPQKIFVFKEKKQGAPAARNRGLNNSKGNWIQFLDADDLLLPEKIEHQIKLVATSPKTVMIAGAGVVQKSNGKIFYRFAPKTDDPFIAIAYTWIGYTCSNLFSSSAIKKIGGWDENLKNNQDTDLIFRLLKNARPKDFIYDSKELTIRRMRPFGQITTSNNVEFNIDSLIFRLKLIEYLQQEKPKYYQNNQEYYEDVIYHFIYRIGIFSPKTAEKYLKKELQPGYQPIAKKNNQISKIHEKGVKLLGFRRYMELRFLLKSVFSFFK